MNNLKKHLIALVVAVGIVGGYFLPLNSVEQIKNISLGTINFVGTLPTTLSGSGITSSATSIGVTSMKISQTGQALTMANFGSIGYVTLEPGVSSRQEVASFTGITQNSNGTAILTGVTRGLSPVSPYTASSTMRFSHGGGTKLIVSNSPPFYDTFANKNNNASIFGQYTFGSTTIPQMATDTTDAQLVANGTSTLATLNYVNGVAVAGAPNATEAVKGIVELGTALETASSTIFGSTGASVVMQSKNATDTPLSGCASGFTSTPGAGCSVIAQLSGKIKQSWLNLTEAFTFTATTTIQASSVTNNALILNGLAYKYPSTRGASSSVMIESGNGDLRWYDGGYTSPYNAYASMSTSSSYRSKLAGLTYSANLIASTSISSGNSNCNSGTAMNRMDTIVVWKYGKVLAEASSYGSASALAYTIYLSKNGLGTTSLSSSSGLPITLGTVYDVVPGDEIYSYCSEDNVAANPYFNGLRLYATSTDSAPVVTY